MDARLSYILAVLSALLLGIWILRTVIRELLETGKLVPKLKPNGVRRWIWCLAWTLERNDDLDLPLWEYPKTFINVLQSEWFAEIWAERVSRYEAQLAHQHKESEGIDGRD